MRFKCISIKEGIYSRKETFYNSVNLIYSSENSKGKTTLIRFLLYALGYAIPNTKKINFGHCEVNVEIETDSGEIIKLNRDGNNYIVANKGKNKRTYILPEQLNELHSMLFGTNNKDILDNLLGSFYFDQEKGWTLLNRGVVIGSIHFNIEELIRGLSGRDCSELINQESTILRELKKYKQIASVAQYQEEISEKSNSLIKDSYEEKSSIELNMLLIEEKALKKEIKRIDTAINSNKNVKKYISDLKLIVKLPNGDIFHVTEDNIIGLNDTIDFLIAKKRFVAKDLKKVFDKINSLKNEQIHESEQLAFFNSESLAESFDRQISTVPINAIAINKEIDQLEKQLRNIRNLITEATKTDNEVVTSLYNNIVKYATELGVGNAETIASSYVFTSNLKELSGAVLHKTVFAFRLAYIIEIQKSLGITLPIILDSPRGKEVDQKNIELMINILKRDFSQNQIIIASIYEYDFDEVNKIEIKNQLIENEN